MVGIAQDKRGMYVLEMLWRKGLDCCLCAHRRKDGRQQVTVGSGKNSRAGTVCFGCDGKLKHDRDYNRPSIPSLQILLIAPFNEKTGQQFLFLHEVP
jgi:hypothetical protein